MSQTTDPFTAAREAALAGDLGTLRRLIEADPDLVRKAGPDEDADGATLLLYAAGWECAPDESVALLLELGADPDAALGHGSTCLHMAAQTDRASTLALLAAAGGSLTRESVGPGGTPLAHALYYGCRDAAEWLAARDDRPRGLRTAAALGDLPRLRELVQPTLRLHPDAGLGRDFYRPYPGFPEREPATDPQAIVDEALCWAARHRRFEAMQLLVDAGADVNADPYRGTALTWAAFKEQPDVALWLLDHDADVDRRGEFGGDQHGEGVTALHIAAQFASVETARVLLDAGADLDIEDDLYGGVAAGWALQFENDELFAMIDEAMQKREDASTS